MHVVLMFFIDQTYWFTSTLYIMNGRWQVVTLSPI